MACERSGALGSLRRWLADQAIMIPRTTGTKETVKSISFSFRMLSDVFDHSISVYSSVRFAPFKAIFDMMLLYTSVESLVHYGCAGAELSATHLSPQAGYLWLQSLQKWLDLSFLKNLFENILLSFPSFL